MSFLFMLTDREVTIIMWIIGGLLSVLLTLLSFFVVRSVNIQDKLSEVVQKLQITLSGMNAVISSIQDEKCEFKNLYEKRHEELQESIESVEETLEDHTERLVRVETKVGVS